MELKDLLSDETFCQRLEAAKDADEAVKLFAEKGITVTREQLEEAKAAAQQEELDEETLDGVSGGIRLGVVSSWGGRFLVELIIKWGPWSGWKNCLTVKNSGRF